MANELLAVVTIASDTNLVADSVQNTFCIPAADPWTEAGYVAVVGHLVSFYNEPTGLTDVTNLSLLMSPTLSTAANACGIDLYDISADLGGTPHGSPVWSAAWTLGAPTGGAVALPSEVAVVATLEGEGRDGAPVEVGVTRPKQRLTGRIYFGPLHAGQSAVIGGVCRPSVLLRRALRESVGRLHADLVADLETGLARLGVWSRASASVVNLAAVSTDDAWDTQRRRGEGPTARDRLIVV